MTLSKYCFILFLLVKYGYPNMDLKIFQEVLIVEQLSCHTEVQYSVCVKEYFQQILLHPLAFKYYATLHCKDNIYIYIYIQSIKLVTTVAHRVSNGHPTN